MNDADKIANAFRKFHRENPSVYDELVKISRSLKSKGRCHYGIKALFEVVRFHRALNTNDPAFKLNNNYTALYARLIMENEPDLHGFFDTRLRKSRINYEIEAAFENAFANMA